MAVQLSWLERPVHTREVEGSIPPAAIIVSLDLQLSWLEQTAHNRRVVGSSPTRSIGSWLFLYKNIAGWSSLVARRAHNPKVIGSNPVPAIWSLGVGVITPPCHGGDHRSESGRDRNGSIAQLVEQRIEAPCVGGSIPSRAIRKQEVAGIVQW